MADLSITKLPWKAQLALFLVLALAAAGAFYYFYEMAKREEIATQERELATIQARIDKGLATARQLPEFRKELDGLQARLDSLKPILPDERDAGDLLRTMQTLAARSNLTMRGFKPQAVTKRTMHAEWPIGLELEGTYHNLGEFLDLVSKYPRLINDGKLDIRAKAQPDPNASIDVSCTATTFVLIPAPPGAPAKPAKTE
jgi:type IV pilus assembly protein PilO